MSKQNAHVLYLLLSMVMYSQFHRDNILGNLLPMICVISRTHFKNNYVIDI